MNIKHDMLRHFVAVAETGSLAAAAARIGRTPSAVSMVLKQFQDTLGAPLFVSDRKAQLTPLGVFTLEQAKAELAHFEAMQRAIGRFAATGTGILRIAAVPSVVAALLPAAMAHFAEDYPEIEIDLRDMDSAAIVQGVQNGQFDIGVASAPKGRGQVRRQPLCDDPYAIFSAPDHPIASAKGPVTWDALNDARIIANPIAATISSATYQAIHARAGLTVHNTISLLSVVQAGLGVSVLPAMVKDLAWAPIAVTPVKDSSALRQLEILHPKKALISPAATAFAESLQVALLARGGLSLMG